MKTKLKIILLLAALALTGIIICQAYWSFNTFKLNKQRFDSDINMVMQRALDSCKKDYFDSIRVVMVKRLSAPGMSIKLDTVDSWDTAHRSVYISVKSNGGGVDEPYSATLPVIAYYRKQIGHPVSLPQLVTEMSFYQPRLLDQILLILGMDDISIKLSGVGAYIKSHPNLPAENVKKLHDEENKKPLNVGIYEMPNNYRQADSIKLYKYYRKELDKLHPKAEFELRFSDKPIPATQTIVPKPFSALWRTGSKPLAETFSNTNQANELMYSETEQYAYKYHGFLFLQHTEKNTLFVRAVFDRAQVGVLKEMILPLLLSGLLIVFTIFCFYYIIRTILQQKKLTELKDDFINNMTHELKTPIATITVAVEGLQKYNALNDPEKTQRYLQTSRNELARLNDLVSKVLNVAAFESKEVRLNKEKVAIDELVNDLVSSETLKAGKQVDISYQNNTGIKYLEADKMHLRNVLANIIDNAVKYCEEPVVIKINFNKVGNNAVISVKDNGMGIPAAHLNHVFDKFHRVPAGNLHNVKGTGLGLNYVKYIVEAHKGNVTVKSETGAGSEFIITLPLGNG
jgi:signal transduction histidine kinase